MNRLFLFISLLAVFILSTSSVNADSDNSQNICVIKDESGWRLMVYGEPFFIKGMCYEASKVGNSSHDNTRRDWMIVDDDNDGRIDVAYQSWVDENLNNERDPNEKEIGDFKLLRDMGCNTLRIYHHPSDDPLLMKLNIRSDVLNNHKPNKDILRKLHKDYGIWVMMGDLLGAYTVGTGAEWSPGTDYRNPEHRRNMLHSVEVMVRDFKDEPYILLWALGNENNLQEYTHTNASDFPEDYAKFANEAAKLIHRLDPTRPVALINGEVHFLDVYGKHAPEIDIIGLNSYRTPGFGNLWEQVEQRWDLPVFLSEYGTQHASIENMILNEEKQAEVHRVSWLDIEGHAYGKKKPGNSIGGFVFSWMDDWWQQGSPWMHDVSPTGQWHWEWNGVISQGDGKHSPLMRQLRKSYWTYKELWTSNTQ